MKKINFYDISKYTKQVIGKKDNIILHWSGGDYETVFEDYHINITGNNDIYIGTQVIEGERVIPEGLTGVRYHAWNRNVSSIGISLCCMCGAIVQPSGKISYYGDYKIKAEQIDMLAKVVAKICVEADIDVEKVYTHSEVAEIDGYGLMSCDPQMRWDLIGYGDLIRKKVLEYQEKWKKEQKTWLK